MPSEHLSSNNLHLTESIKRLIIQIIVVVWHACVCGLGETVSRQTSECQWGSLISLQPQSGLFRFVCSKQAHCDSFLPGTPASFHTVLKTNSDHYAGMTSLCPVYDSETHIKPINPTSFLTVQWSRGVIC